MTILGHYWPSVFLLQTSLPSVPLVLLRFHVKYLIWSILTSNDSNNSKEMYAGFFQLSLKS